MQSTRSWQIAEPLRLRQFGLSIAFTFDGPFAEQGFTVLP